jgi:hypothetical protein
MTSESARSTTGGRSRSTNGAEAGSRAEYLQGAVREIRNALAGVSGTVPEVARASRGAVDDLVRAIENSSDDRVSASVAMSLGMAMGMLLGGAPRVLIVAALVPVAISGIVQTERRAGRSRAGSASAA